VADHDLTPLTHKCRWNDLVGIQNIKDIVTDILPYGIHCMRCYQQWPKCVLALTSTLQLDDTQIIKMIQYIIIHDNGFIIGITCFSANLYTTTGWYTNNKDDITYHNNDNGFIIGITCFLQ